MLGRRMYLIGMWVALWLTRDRQASASLVSSPLSAFPADPESPSCELLLGKSRWHANLRAELRYEILWLLLMRRRNAAAVLPRSLLLYGLTCTFQSGERLQNTSLRYRTRKCYSIIDYYSLTLMFFFSCRTQKGILKQSSFNSFQWQFIAMAVKLQKHCKCMPNNYVPCLCFRFGQM